jgi:DNA-binding response OmpR family regulator
VNRGRATLRGRNCAPLSSRACRILLVEDDEKLAEEVLASLRQAKFDPVWVASGAEAMELPPDQFALVILDLVLPGAHGLDVLKRFRARSDVPILVLSARSDAADKVRALKIGADDFVTKPFWPDELLERVNARLRRPTLMRGSEIRIGPFVIDLSARSARVRGRDVDLTKAEFDLLAALARRLDDAVPRGVLEEAALGSGREPGDRALDVHMSRLRKKLGPDGRCLRTVRGVGYRFAPRPTDSGA